MTYNNDYPNNLASSSNQNNLKTIPLGARTCNKGTAGVWTDHTRKTKLIGLQYVIGQNYENKRGTLNVYFQWINDNIVIILVEHTTVANITICSMYNGGYLLLVQEPRFSLGQLFTMMTMMMRILLWWTGDGDISFYF